MAVGALGRPPGAPRGRLVAPDGSPGPPKCVKFNNYRVNSQLFCEWRALATPERALLRRDRLGLRSDLAYIYIPLAYGM